MTLIEFINHLKHKSIGLNVFHNGKIIFLGDVGTYMHWVGRNLYDGSKVNKIEPIPTDSFNIFINLNLGRILGGD